MYVCTLMGRPGGGSLKLIAVLVGECVKTGTIEPNRNYALDTCTGCTFEGQLNSFPNWELKTLYVFILRAF